MMELGDVLIIHDSNSDLVTFLPSFPQEYFSYLTRFFFFFFFHLHFHNYCYNIFKNSSFFSAFQPKYEPSISMASSTKLTSFSLFLAFFFICSSPPQVHSLSTVSISTITPNQTLICALIPSPNQQSFINCSSFPIPLRNPIGFGNVSYSRIVGGRGFLCAYTSPTQSSSNSTMECWRFSGNNNSNNISPKRVYRGPNLIQLEAGNSHVCGLTDNDLKCWQWKKDSNPDSESHPKFSAIAVGDEFVCGLNSNGNISCLGKTSINVDPTGNYSAIAAGSGNLCGISSKNRTVECWGRRSTDQWKIPEGEFMGLALGDDRGCAVRSSNGTVVCWGRNNFEIPKSLNEDSFIGISAKEGVFCGVLTSNFSLVCWGNESLSLNNNGSDFSSVFDRVMPGECTAECSSSCGALPGSGAFCGPGLMVCPLCPGPVTPPGPGLGPSPAQDGSRLGSNGSSRRWNAKMVVLLVVGCLGSASLLATIVFSLTRFRRLRRGSSRVHDSGPMGDVEGEDDDVEAGESVAGPLGLPQPVLQKRLSHMYSLGNGGILEEFSLETLLHVTDNFSPAHRIGIGSFGSVYRATLSDGREVAIKRAELHVSHSAAAITEDNNNNRRRQKEDQDSAFLAELEFLSRLNHKHLVRLYGFHEDADERVLVYEYMSNGTLHDHLHRLKSSSPLSASWAARFQAALDAARGIEYLHEYARPTIIHRDIKPSNILLDGHGAAKVSDFGLSLMGPQEGEAHVDQWAAGTFGYVDPEYYRLHRLTTKSDVYSFGVVLLELLTGLRAIHVGEDGLYRNVVEFVVPYVVREELHRVLDPHVPPPTPVEIEAVNCVGNLAAHCVHPEGRCRPTMTEVVGCLESAVAACLAPFSFSPQSSTVSSLS